MKYFWNITGQQERIINYILRKYKICRYDRYSGKEFTFKLRYGRSNTYSYRTGEVIKPDTLFGRITIEVMYRYRSIEDAYIAFIDRHGNITKPSYGTRFSRTWKKDEEGYTYFE